MLQFGSRTISLSTISITFSFWSSLQGLWAWLGVKSSNTLKWNWRAKEFQMNPIQYEMDVNEFRKDEGEKAFSR